MQKNRLKELKKDASYDEGFVRDGLLKIYSNADGSLPDISHLELKRRGRLKIFLISFVAIALLLSAAAWLGFAIFNSGANGSSQSLDLKISGQQSVASGDEVTYIINYKNIDKVTVRNVEIIARYPDGFTFESANPPPVNSFNTTWDMGDLATGQSGRIEIKGKMIGEVGSIQTVSATASYRPENFSSSFKQSQSFNSQVTSSILEMDITGPSQILPEKQAVYTISYQNNSDQDLSNVKILLQYPANFLFQHATPTPFLAPDQARNLNNVWIIDSLPKQQKGEIDLSGGFVADPQNPIANLTAQIGFFTAETNQFSLQQEKTIATAITQPNLSLNLIINGSNQDTPITFGQTLAYSIVYKNLGQNDLSNISVTLTINSGILDLGSIVDAHNGKVVGNQITWTKDQLSQLALLRPLAEGTIDFTVKTKDADKVNVGKDNLTVLSTATATIEKIGDLPESSTQIDSQQIKNVISTDVTLKAEGRYFDDDNNAVGTGPLPPVVGQQTTFRMFWSIANSLHEIDNVKMTAVLPPGIGWANKTISKVGSLSFSSKDRTVTWTISKIDPNKSFDDTSTWFDVAVTPTKNQAKTLLILLDQINLVATDKITNTPITKTESAITSNLEFDPFGSGKGLVIDITQ